VAVALRFANSVSELTIQVVLASEHAVTVDAGLIDVAIPVAFRSALRVGVTHTDQVAEFSIGAVRVINALHAAIGRATDPNDQTGFIRVTRIVLAYQASFDRPVLPVSAVALLSASLVMASSRGFIADRREFAMFGNKAGVFTSAVNTPGLTFAVRVNSALLRRAQSIIRTYSGFTMRVMEALHAVVSKSTRAGVLPLHFAR
jgi:hypothetical protein